MMQSLRDYLVRNVSQLPQHKRVCAAFFYAIKDIEYVNFVVQNDEISN